MDNYTASYRTSLDPVLRDMTIDIKGNEKVIHLILILW